MNAKIILLAAVLAGAGCASSGTLSESPALQAAEQRFDRMQDMEHAFGQMGDQAGRHTLMQEHMALMREQMQAMDTMMDGHMAGERAMMSGENMSGMNEHMAMMHQMMAGMMAQQNMMMEMQGQGADVP